jgi:L-ascorbate metabolism protein UlaG (beta-lactamase superfamily)
MKRKAISELHLRAAWIMVFIGVFILSSQALAQSSLRDMVTERGFDWLIGHWEAVNDQGQKINVVYSWELDGHMIAIDFKMDQFAYKGMIVHIPSRDSVVEVGIDNKNTSVKGTWEATDDKAISKTERTDASGNTIKATVYHSQPQADTLKLDLYIWDEETLTDKSIGALDFKRLPPPKDGEDAVKEEKITIGEFGFEEDTFKTSQGDLKITCIGHGTLMFVYDGKTIHVDPWSRLADYAKLPKADLILVTHEHRDHLDTEAIAVIQKDNTRIVINQACAQKVPSGIVMKNGDTRTLHGLKIEAVPAYNMVHKRSSGEPYHPKGNGNGYIVTFGDKRIYIAGDTENIPEMKSLKNVDVAFLPMNLPYTMTPEMVADAAKVFKPKILYPYHYGQTDPSSLVNLLKDSPNIEVRIRKLQ